METQEEIQSFLDFLALDEEMIDTRLKSLMVKTHFSNKHLISVIQLLLYKNLINTQENTECSNDEEFDFTVRLLREVNSDNVDKICKIVNIVLSLNKTNIVSKSEHLLQQILSNIDCRPDTLSSNSENQETLMNLEVCDSIIDAAINNNEKLSLLFLEIPLEKIIDFGDEKLKMYFLTNTVPRLFEGVMGYNIIDRIWTHIKEFKNEKLVNALTVLTSLSDYYLPAPDTRRGTKYVSEIIFQYDFWNIILFGLESNDSAVRKVSVYLSKKAIDCVMALKRNINIQSETKTIFVWEVNHMKSLKTMWDNFFILLDSLEEKQSNIVLPSLKLFVSIKIGESWLNCAYNIGLRHDNTQIRLKCVEYRLRNAIRNERDAVTVLTALNDINIYDQKPDYEGLKENISNSLKDDESLAMIVEAIPTIKWSPVPLYHLTDVLAKLNQNYPFSHKVIDIFKVSCNNVAIRKAVHTNVIYFIINCCHNLNWVDVTNILSIEDLQRQGNDNIHFLIKGISVDSNEEKQAFYNTMTKSYKAIAYLLIYLSVHEEDIYKLIDIINEKIKIVQNVVNRQYSDKKECLEEANFLLHLLIKTSTKENRVKETLNELITRENKTIILYIQSLLSNETSLTIEEIKALAEDFDVYGDDLKDILLQLYKTCVLLLNDTNNLDKTVLSAMVIRALMKNKIMVESYKHEMLDAKRFLKMIDNLKFGDSQNQSVGRLKNVLYETACGILYMLIKENNSKIDHDVKEVVDFVENVLECGGYGCLRLILQIVNQTVQSLLNETLKFDIVQFINRTWNEIEELKSNNQYTPCIQEFINLITQDAILEKSMFNNIVMLYCNRIIEYGPVKNYPLYYLITILRSKKFKNCGQLVYVLSEILLYCPVPRRDQRIADNITLEILRDPKFGVNERDVDIHFNFEIQNLAVATLTKIDEAETLQVITSFITNRINETFKNKQRYHGNSHLHKVLLIALQHLLILLIKSRSRLDETFNWSIGMLVKLPHQPSVRICFEWFISLNFYIQKFVLSDRILQILRSKNVPLTSQFVIIYWLLKHKITNNTYTNDEYEFVMDFLLSHTMGQLFNVRLNAQYFATKLYNMAQPTPKYAYTIKVIESTFTENVNDNNFVKLKNDYFAHEFDIIRNLSPYFIYYVLPRYCGDSYSEEVNIDCMKYNITDMDHNLRNEQDADDFKKEWIQYCKVDEKFVNIEINKGVHNKMLEDMETSGTIQKKYIPWKNMSDINVYNIEKKKLSSSELIVVATLIDKLPNLGGMARTSEVFGVNTYVVDSLRHLQDKQFQGLSVSAERWINVEEVRPGRPLKEYLIKKKAEGYAVVAAEQTSTSCKLQTFKFPKKTLLLLGHEKEGIPCDLLPMMDHCVEIPQQGYVRSLNVHVTAAIFVWEYTRQNIL